MKNMKKWCALALSFIVVTSGAVSCGQAENDKEQKQAAITNEKKDKDIFQVLNSENSKEDTEDGSSKELETLQKTVTEKKPSTEKEETSISAKEEHKSSKTSKESNSQKKPSSAQGTLNGSSSTASKKPDTSSKPSNSGNSTKPQKPAHTHEWVAVTKEVHHEATGHYEKVLVKKAWTEKIPIFETVAVEICNTCGADITNVNIPAHVKKHMLAGEDKGGHRTEYKEKQTGTKTIEHPAEYKDKWVEDSKAWTETVTTGYKCSCGAKK